MTNALAAVLEDPEANAGHLETCANAGPSSRRSREDRRAPAAIRSMSCRWRVEVRRIGPGRWFSVLLPVVVGIALALCMIAGMTLRRCGELALVDGFHSRSRAQRCRVVARASLGAQVAFGAVFVIVNVVLVALLRRAPKGSMSRMLRLFLPLTVVAASVVTAIAAAPPTLGINAPLTMADATAMMQKTAVIAALLPLDARAVSLTLLSGREIRYSSIEMRRSALHCFALGLVAVTSFALTAIVFSYLIPFHVGVPLLFALGVIAILTKIYGTVAVFQPSHLVAGNRTREQLARDAGSAATLPWSSSALPSSAPAPDPHRRPIIWAFASSSASERHWRQSSEGASPWFLAWRTSLS